MLFGKKTIVAIGAALAAGSLAGCAMGGEGKEDNVKSTLKVMYYNEQSFYQQYGMLFSALYPEVEVEVVSTQDVNYEEGKDMQKAMEDFIAERKPDVLMLSADEYSRMAEEGKLQNLEAYIKKDKFDLEGIAPGILEYIKQQSGGVLYGLAPTFYSQALYYNKDLFAKHGVEFPEDRMSWEKVLQLAARFPTTGDKENRVYGLKAGYQTNLYYFGNSIGASLGLTYIHPSSRKLMINSDSWKSVYEMAHKAMESGTLYMENMDGSFTSNSYDDFLLRDPFISGKVAMAIDGNYLMDQIKQKNESSTAKDKGVQNWDVVTVPVNPQNPEESTGMSIGQIFAISANSANMDAAWNFISYVNGDEFARVTSKLQNGGFPARTKYLSADGIHAEAFYSLKPMSNNMYKDFDKLPQQFFVKFDGLAQQEFQSITDGKQSVSEALDSLQAKGQQLLDDEARNEGKSGDASDGAGASGETGASTESAIVEEGETEAVAVPVQ